MGPPAELRPERSQRRLSAREIAEELVPLAREAAGDERCRDRGGPGQHGHRDTRAERRHDETCTRIVDPGEPRIARQRDAVTRGQSRQHLGGPPRLVVPVVADELARAYAVAIEQDPRAARVLAEDE